MKALSDLLVQPALRCLESRNLLLNKYPYSPFGASFAEPFLFFSFSFFLSFYLYSSFYFWSSLRFFLFYLFCLSRLAAHVSIHCPLSNLFILLFLCHLKQGRKSGGQKISQWVYAIYGQLLKTSVTLIFVLHSFCPSWSLGKCLIIITSPGYRRRCI